MAKVIDPRQKAGPVGRPRLSYALMQRKGLADPRQRRSANLLATNRRTARGVNDVALDYTGVPLVEEVQLQILVSKINELLANLRERGLMELTP